MKYFIDTEFIEGFSKPLFCKKRHFIDLISIGIVAEDGREYYAVSTEFNTKDADQWVKDNVISKLPCRYPGQHDSPRLKAEAILWKTNKQIAEEIIDFTMPYAVCSNGESCCKFYDPHPDDLKEILTGHHELKMKVTAPEFYAYYADYDWVVFCSLFGRMIDLPKGWPMYCKDLKQILDEKQDILNRFSTNALNLKDSVFYPKQINEHSALGDAKWNYNLFKFLRDS